MPYARTGAITQENKSSDESWVYISDAQYTQFLAGILAGQTLRVDPAGPILVDRLADSDPEPTPPSTPAEAEVTVSRAQARIALYNEGLLDQVEAAVAQADVPTQIAWADAQYFSRESPTLRLLARVLGLDEKQLDDLFFIAQQVQI